MFFKIVVLEDPDPDVETPVVLAFLFPHQRARHGEIENFLVSVDVVEALTGLDFLRRLARGSWRIGIRLRIGWGFGDMDSANTE
jgi:DNA/RNA endonuclease G (NUC1)